MELVPGASGGELRGFCEAHRGVTEAEVEAAAAAPQTTRPRLQPAADAAPASPSAGAAAGRGATPAAPAPDGPVAPPPLLPLPASSVALVSEGSWPGLSLASPLPPPPHGLGLARQNSALSDVQADPPPG